MSTVPNSKPKTSSIRFLDNSSRLVTVGRTGTGKTVAGLYHLSRFDFSQDPWVIINAKGDQHIDDIPNTQEIDLDYKFKKNDAGIFIVRPLPGDFEGTLRERSRMASFLWHVWERENTGIFTDESFMMGNNDAFIACQTQGRSKHIPMISCTQRPVWITRFCFSEASFIQVFDLNDARDIQTVESFVPVDFDAEKLKKYHSYYYDIGEDNLVMLKPVPPVKKILEIFDAKLPKRKNWI